MGNIRIRKYSTGSTEVISVGSYVQTLGLPTSTEAGYALKSIVDSLTAAVPGLSIVASASLNSYPAALMSKFVPTEIEDGSSTPFPLTSIFTASRIQWEGDVSYLQALSASYKDSSFPVFPSTTRGGNKYFGVGNQLLRYDGHALSHACVNNLPSLVAIATSSGGSLATGSYMAMCTFEVRDANGVIYESPPAYSNVVGVSSGQQLHYTLPVNAYRPSWTHNYDSWGAVVSGNQTVSPVAGIVTFSATGGGAGIAPKMLVGDTAYVYAVVNSIPEIISAQVASLSATTIGLSYPSAISVTNSHPISPGVFVNLYRSKVGPSQLFYRTILPTAIIEDSWPNSIIPYTYGDTLADESLGSEYIFPSVSPSPLPTLTEPIRALATYRGSLLVASSDTVYYSDSVVQEGFPPEFYYKPSPQDPTPITGFAPRADHHLVFKENSVAIVSGELVTGQFVVDTLTNSVGCIAPNSIVQIDSDEGSFDYWLDKHGVYRQTGSAPPQLVSDIEGSSIQAIFTEVGNLRTSSSVGNGGLQFNRATAYHDLELKLYVLCIPSGTLSSGYPDDFRTFVFNYKKNEWYEWSNYSFSQGAVTTSDRGVFTAERNVLSGAVRSYIQKRLSLGGAWDYSDDEQGIDWSYKSGFDALGEPAIKKDVIRMKAESSDISYPGSDSNGTTSFSITMAISQPTHENSTIGYKTIQPATKPSATLKAKKTLGLSHAFTVGGTALEEKPVVTGVQMEYAIPYSPIIKEKSNG